MAASMDSDEEDTFVTVGTPLELIDDDAVPKRAPALQDQTVTDKRGRQRFHGAFTGGFSAGFFNTVGSKEGFIPSTFVSSKSQKPETSDGKCGQRPEDFMDDEDLGEFGIAPQKITASDDFASLSTLRKRKAPIAERRAIPDLNLEDLILPSKVPIGMRLLKKMGWKEGQGVGPRVKKKKKKSKQADQAGAKVYGCAFRPLEDEDSSSDDNVHQDVTFAPKDISPFNFDPKNNLHGIGYRGLDPKAALYGHVTLFEPPAAVSKSGKKGITGHAFGVGALNEDDDDVYGVQSMIGYDRELTDESDSTYGWTAPKHKQGYSNQLALKGPDYIGKMLAGFTLGSKPLKPKKTYPAPPPPRDFRPIHVFKKPVDILGLPIPSPPEIAKKYGTDSDVKMDANTRGAIIGEKSLIGSIFDLVSKEDKEKMKAAKDGTFTQPLDASSAQASTSQPQTSRSPAPCCQPDTAQIKSRDLEGPSKGHEPSKSSWKEVISPSTSGHAGFKPFARNPEKQARYEQYLEAQKHGVKYVSECVQQTEWEREHEREEFAKAAKLYKPLSMMMANRFTRGKFDDNDETVEVPADEKLAKSDQAKAVEMKMYGKMTRDIIEWHPDKLLCRRFNVANPYPDSSQVGSLKVKRDKFSVFNFMNAPKPKEQRQHSPPRAIEFKEDPPPTPDDEQMTTRPVVSFVIGMAKKKDSVEITKEEALGSAKQAEDGDGPKDMELDEKKVETSADERPPMDLFKAIFDASESSSASSSEEEEIDNKLEQKSNLKNEADSSTLQGLQTEGKKLHRFLLPSQREKRSRWDPAPEAGDSTMDTNDRSEVTSPPVDSGNLSENIDQISSTSETVMGISQTVLFTSETVSSSKLEDRLGFCEGMEKSDDDEGVFGPRPLFLPKVCAPPAESGGKVKTDKDKHRKKKHKHKDKHKHKKKKDKKEKKTKHKKKKKHKERSKHKTKKKREVSSSSGSEADSETSDSGDEGEPSTRDLLSKIRNLPGKRLAAADFM
ncbi:G patch domain-containing protein 1-like isoform X2 [Lineus longissimus]|uniref:G patch domain-containing protein 1-like isoform X2 n=1 Tax=Lineus longissimus TaxID=88925 RepID=UPI00315DA4E5